MDPERPKVRCVRYVGKPTSLVASSKPRLIPFPEPSTGTVMGQVANCTREDFQTAIQSASIAQPEFFESTTGASRGALLRKWNDLILANAEDSTAARNAPSILLLVGLTHCLSTTSCCNPFARKWEDLR